jgi:hypothetical protein
MSKELCGKKQAKFDNTSMMGDKDYLKYLSVQDMRKVLNDLVQKKKYVPSKYISKLKRIELCEAFDLSS